MSAPQETETIADNVMADGLTVSPVSGPVVTIRGDVLTAPGKKFAAPSLLQDVYAFMSDGTMLVAHTKRYDAKVESFVSNLQIKGQKVSRFVEVPISELKKVYATSRHSVEEKATKAGDDQDPKMKRAFIELVGRGAAVDASDIHITADDRYAAIQMRIDGILVNISELPPAYAKQLMQAAYAMGTSSETNYNPQAFQPGSIIDSNGKLGLPSSVQSMRLQWSPLMLNGRYLVMRLHHTNLQFDANLVTLGYSKSQLELIRQIRLRPYGILVIAGPTGSGKTTTLKINLSNQLQERRGEINAISVEDPAENYIAGIKQTQVMNATSQEDREQKFTIALNSILRQDPDAVMIGEMRDLESVRIAYKTALSGHSVCTSLHANTAIGVIPRLLDIGLESYKVTDHETFIGLVGQRLVRRLCQHCKIPLRQAVEKGQIARGIYDMTIKYFEDQDLDQSKLSARNLQGCKHCDRKKGIAGRTVVAEVIMPDEEFMELMRDQRRSAARAHWIKKLGGFTMMTHAVSKMALGLVSPEDVTYMVNPIIQDESADRVQMLIEEALAA